jgi:hypothetical protein
VHRHGTDPMATRVSDAGGAETRRPQGVRPGAGLGSRWITACGPMRQHLTCAVTPAGIDGCAPCTDMAQTPLRCLLPTWEVGTHGVPMSFSGCRCDRRVLGYCSAVLGSPIPCSHPTRVFGLISVQRALCQCLGLLILGARWAHQRRPQPGTSGTWALRRVCSGSCECMGPCGYVVERVHT